MRFHGWEEKKENKDLSRGIHEGRFLPLSLGVSVGIKTPAESLTNKLYLVKIYFLN